MGPQPTIPTGQEILEQLNQLEEEYASSGIKNSIIGGGREGRTTPSLEEVAQSTGKVDDNVATSPRPITPPRPAPLTPAPPTPTPPSPSPHPASPIPAPTPAPPTAGPPPVVPPAAIEAPISSRLRKRPEKTQKWKASMGLVPNKDEGQSNKRKAPEEGEQSVKRAKTVVENTKTPTRKRAGARNAGTNKQGPASKSSMSLIFSDLMLP